MRLHPARAPPQAPPVRPRRSRALAAWYDYPAAKAPRRRRVMVPLSRPQIEHDPRPLLSGKDTRILLDRRVAKLVVGATAEHELLTLRANEHLEPRIPLHDGVEDALLVRVLEQEELNF